MSDNCTCHMYGWEVEEFHAEALEKDDEDEHDLRCFILGKKEYDDFEEFLEAVAAKVKCDYGCYGNACTGDITHVLGIDFNLRNAPKIKVRAKEVGAALRKLGFKSMGRTREIEDELEC